MQNPGAAPQWPFGTGYQASLNPPDTTRMHMQNPGVVWARTPIHIPMPWMPYAEDNSIGQQLRRYVVAWSADELEAGSPAIGRIRIDPPGAVFAISGGAYRSGQDLTFPAGTGPLDNFLVRMEHDNGDRLDSQAGIATAMIGTAETPALLPGPAWKLGGRTTVLIEVTPLLASMNIYVVLWYMEVRGPTNLSNIG